MQLFKKQNRWPVDTVPLLLSQDHPGRLWDSKWLSHGHPDAYGTANHCPKAVRTPMGQSISLPKAIRTPVGRHVTHLGQLCMAMGMRTGMGRTPLGLNNPVITTDTL